MSTITSPYETLIRHNPDGSIGAQHQKIKRYYDDDTEPPELINEKIQAPVQLNVVAGELAAVVGQAFVQATAQIASQATTITQLNSALNAANGALADRNSEIAGLVQTGVERDAALAARDAAITGLQAQIVALQAQVLALTPPSANAEEPAPEA